MDLDLVFFYYAICELERIWMFYMKRKKLEGLGGEQYEGLDVEYYIDSDTGELKAVYTFNNEIVERVKLSGRIAARASSLSLIHRDLKSAKEWYQKANDLVERKELTADGKAYGNILDLDLSSEIRALFVASLTFYGKAFSEAKGRKLKMERDWLDSDYFELHDSIINYRHNFAAHSGNQDYESAETSLLLIRKNGKTFYQAVTDRKQMSMIGVEEEHVNMIDLFEHAIQIVEKKYNETLERIRTYVMQKSYSFWCLAAAGKDPVNLDESNKKKK